MSVTKEDVRALLDYNLVRFENENSLIYYNFEIGSLELMLRGEYKFEVPEDEAALAKLVAVIFYNGYCAALQDTKEDIEWLDWLDDTWIEDMEDE